jgi:hypothetical protein
MNQNNLNTYSDDSEFLDNFKGIIKIAIILFLLFLIPLIIVSIFVNNFYPSIIGFCVCFIENVIMLYITNKMYVDSYYGDYKKVTKKVHFINQMVFGITFVILLLLFTSFSMALGLALGLIIIKLATLISTTKINNK